MTERQRTEGTDSSDDPPDLVRAAGGVVWRRGRDGIEVLLVHRPRYDDWSLPKGKCLDGESDEDCARREVTEETGLTCTLGDELRPVRYRDRKDRPKRVRYWAMTECGDGSATPFVANDEVDEVRWLSVPEARARLSYDHDADLLSDLDLSH